MMNFCSAALISATAVRVGSSEPERLPRAMLTDCSCACSGSPSSTSRVGMKRAAMDASGVPSALYLPLMARLSEKRSYCFPSISIGLVAIMDFGF